MKPRGAKDLHEYMTAVEQRTEHNDRARLKKKLHKKRNR